MSDNQSSKENELEVSYSSTAFNEKLIHYQLKTQTVVNKLRVNKKALKLALNKLVLLQDLSEVIASWKSNADVITFYVYINQLIFSWLNAISNGAATTDVLHMLRSLEIKTALNTSNTTQFHFFLYDLVTETVHYYQQTTISYVLNYDANTHLPNEKQLILNLNKLIEKPELKSQVCLLSIYFHTSKSNFNYSKTTSIDISKEISQALQKHIPDDCQLYINNNSQFDILISDLTSIERPSLLAAKIAQISEEMLFLNNQSIFVTPFIGYTHVKITDLYAAEFYSNAKVALESAINKQLPLVLFSHELKILTDQKDFLESKVLEGFNADNLTLFFQPIVRIDNSKCTGAELLLRWNEKFSCTTSPSQTIDILNKVGKGKMFTRWLINSACRYASELIHNQKLNIYLTLNLRAEDLHDTELPHLLSQAIALWKIDAKDIILEITENGILQYNDDSNSNITNLTNQGLKFAIDDFGTGYSSLSRLRSLPINLIKIDQSFVKDIYHSKDDFEIVQSITMLAKSLGKEVLAEGIEDEKCLSKIKQLDINKGQGYFFSKPMPYEEFVEWVKSQQQTVII